MKLGILKTDEVRPKWIATHGDYPDMFAALLQQVDATLEIEVFDVRWGEYPEAIDQVDAYLITGSRFSVYDDLPWIYQLADFVRRLNQVSKKLVGICFGHQMIAHVLGGKTEKSAQGWGVGRHTVELTDKACDFAATGTPFSILVSHQDQVIVPAEGAQVLASSEFCPIAMCQLGNHLLSFQGHPEFLPAYSQQILTMQRETYGEALYQQGVESLDLPLDRSLVASWIIDFIRA